MNKDIKLFYVGIDQTGKKYQLENINPEIKHFGLIKMVDKSYKYYAFETIYKIECLYKNTLKAYNE